MKRNIIHLTHKLDILPTRRRKKPQNLMERQMVLWWLEFRLKLKKMLEFKVRFRGTLKESSEKNNSLLRLKPPSEGVKYEIKFTMGSGKSKKGLSASCREGKKIAPLYLVQS
ncbi:hypothetical protein AVEN_103517-1 [Araneus ventricosus]|uniref:Uncharacterized protein n=1 Tax=Araneus ventricosus TaxID=182803 RepID=A0A4Y2PEF0_ARAVE|nr:hypothetical protein AVEN_103517-1 [Araneus ventricosus]